MDYELIDTEHPMIVEIDEPDKREIIAACKLFFGRKFDKLATVSAGYIDYNGSSKKGVKYYLKDGKEIATFSIRFRENKKINTHYVPSPSRVYLDLMESTTPARLHITFQSSDAAPSAEINENFNFYIDTTLDRYFNRGVPATYIEQLAQYEKSRQQENDETDQIIVDRETQDTIRRNKDDALTEKRNAIAIFIGDNMEQVIKNNYADVLTRLKENSKLKGYYDELDSNTIKDIFIQSTKSAASRSFEKATLKSSYTTTTTNGMHILLKLPQNMKI